MDEKQVDKNDRGFFEETFNSFNTAFIGLILVMPSGHARGIGRCKIEEELCSLLL